MSSHSCELCAVRCSSAAVLAEHMSGKKHAHAVEMAASQAALAARSVFLANIYGDACIRGEIERVMSAFGAMDRIVLDRAYGGAHFAIVEFHCADDAQNLLQNHKRVQIGNCLASVRERKMDFNVVKSEDFCDFTCAEAVDVLRGIAVDETKQLDALTAHFSLSHEAYLERFAFAKQLSSYLQQFFADSIEVAPFGSTTTELAFYNSDLDLNFHFTSGKFAIAANHNRSTSPSRSAEDVDDIVKEPLNRAQFVKLSNAERAQLLTKLINKFRKDSANIASITNARNARYPIVRFDLRLSRIANISRPQPGLLVCDLSIENSFSERKANFIAEVYKADVSGTFRKFLFTVKLWAYCNRLLTTKSEEHKPGNCVGRWKSYTLSLLAVSFLQARKNLTELAMHPNSACLAGWPVDCDLPNFDLSGVNVSKLLKEFFIFLYNTVRDSNVHCVRDAKIVPKARFKREFTGSGCFIPSSSLKKSHFKFALVNVQDPFELTHNVAAGVSRDALTHFRRILMFSIVALKQQHERQSKQTDLSSIFRINELEMSFVSATSDNAAQNVLHRKSANILVIPTGAARPPSGIVFDAFISLLQDVLLLELVDEPPVKRFRQNNNSDATADENETNLRDGRSVEFLARYHTWLGRRQLRRNLMNNQLIGNLPPLLLEREVSKGLRDNEAKGDQSELFCFGVQLHLGEVDLENDNASDTDNNSVDIDAETGDNDDNEEYFLTNGCHNTSDLTGAELYVIFHPAHNLSPAQCNACRDLMHFLSTFLAKHLPMRVTDVMETLNSDNMPRLTAAKKSIFSESVSFYNEYCMDTC